MYDNSHVQWPGVVNRWLKGLKKLPSFLLPITALTLSLPVSLSIHRAALAQVPINVPSAQNLPTDLPPPRDVVPPQSPPQQPEPVPSPPPSPEQLLPNQNQSPQQQEESTPVVLETFTFDVKGFDFGRDRDSVFTKQQLLRAMEVFLNNPEQEIEVRTFQLEQTLAARNALFANLEEEKTNNEVIGNFYPKYETPKEQTICDQLLVNEDDKSTQESSSRKFKLTATEQYPIKMSFAQLLRARLGITQLYICKGYITSGAVIPAEQYLGPSDGVIKIRLVEGSLEDIKISGTERLNDSYIRSRLERANKIPLNRENLLECIEITAK